LKNISRRQTLRLALALLALAAAVACPQSRETERAKDFSDQEATFGSLLGPMPTRRARTNGIVIYKKATITPGHDWLSIRARGCN
jgi:hypothetical protein